MQKLHSMCPEKQALILMFGHSCQDCRALFVEMRSAVDDAKAIVAEAGELIHASKPSEHLDGWWQTRDRWQSAHRRWMLASAELKNHLRHTGSHQLRPEAARTYGQPLDGALAPREIK